MEQTKEEGMVINVESLFDALEICSNMIPDTETNQKTSQKMQVVLRGAVAKLDEPEKSVIKMIYGLDGVERKNTEEIAALIGKTVDQIQFIHTNALKALRTLE